MPGEIVEYPLGLVVIAVGEQCRRLSQCDLDETGERIVDVLTDHEAARQRARGQTEAALFPEEGSRTRFVEVENDLTGHLTGGGTAQPRIAHLGVPFGCPSERELGIFQVARRFLPIDAEAQRQHAGIESALCLTIVSHTGEPPKRAMRTKFRPAYDRCRYRLRALPSSRA